MRADKIAQGNLQGQPPIDAVVSMQEREDGTTMLSFHSGITTVEVETNAPFVPKNYQDSSIQKTSRGFKARVQANQGKTRGGCDWIIVKGKINKMSLQQNEPKKMIHLFINDKRVAKKKEIHWSRPKEPQQKQVSQASAQEGGIMQTLSDYWPYIVGGVGGLLLLYKYME